ncbi:MAG: ATP-binding cassette domain-containing protein [Chitinophagaceae bacterium]
MTISLSDAGKRFNRDWIFRHFNYTFNTGNSYAIVGPNGSGKSTLLQAIGGAIGLSEGKLVVSSGAWHVRHQAGSGKRQVGNNDEASSPDNLYQSIAIAAPYLEVIEEMTVTEFLHFHQTFKPLLPILSIKEIITVIGLETASGKQIRYYSSGMKQRVKLAQAIFSDVPVILLDEPCTNLDTTGIALYQKLISDYCTNRLVIVSSNDEAEYGFCKEKLNMTVLK